MAMCGKLGALSARGERASWLATEMATVAKKTMNELASVRLIIKARGKIR
jgi:hypothetical protein